MDELVEPEVVVTDELDVEEVEIEVDVEVEVEVELVELSSDDEDEDEDELEGEIEDGEDVEVLLGSCELENETIEPDEVLTVKLEVKVWNK